MQSDLIKKGVERAPNRSLLYALGFTDEEIRRPLIGVVSSHNEIIPGHMNLDKIAEAIGNARIRVADIGKIGFAVSRLQAAKTVRAEERAGPVFFMLCFPARVFFFDELRENRLAVL